MAKVKDVKLIVIFGGALKQSPSGKWQTTKYFEGDNFGISGDHYRILAAGYLFQNNHNLFFLVSGGKGQYSDIPEAPAVADVLKNELVSLNVPARRIILENKSGNTLEELLALQIYLGRNNKYRKITIVSNRYHLPRIKTFLRHYPLLKDLNKVYSHGNLKLLAAESVLIKADPAKWKKIIEKAYNSRLMQKRLDLESAGVKQIKNGTYNFQVNKRYYEKS